MYTGICHFKLNCFGLNRMQNLAHLLEYQLQTGQRLFLLSHLLILDQETSDGQAMSFLSNTEMAGF